MAQRGLVAAPLGNVLYQQENAVRQVLERMFVQNSEGVKTVDKVHVRNLSPELDLASGADNGSAVDNDTFEQTGLTADQANEVYSIDSDNEADGKIIAFVAVRFPEPNPSTKNIEFKSKTGGIFERLITGAIPATEGVIGLLKRPIIYGLADGGSIRMQPSEAGDEFAVLHGLVAEQRGEELADSSKILTPQDARNLGVQPNVGSVPPGVQTTDTGVGGGGGGGGTGTTTGSAPAPRQG